MSFFLRLTNHDSQAQQHNARSVQQIRTAFYIIVDQHLAVDFRHILALIYILCTKIMTTTKYKKKQILLNGVKISRLFDITHLFFSISPILFSNRFPRAYPWIFVLRSFAALTTAVMHKIYIFFIKNAYFFDQNFFSFVYLHFSFLPCIYCSKNPVFR
jgi:hypothetical protein